MTSLYKRATPAQHRILRIVEGAVKATQFECGFIDGRGKFLDREEAAQAVIEHCIPHKMREPGPANHNRWLLFTEDLW